MFEFKLGMYLQKFRSCPCVKDTKNPWKLTKDSSKLSNKGTFSIEVFIWKKLLKFLSKLSFHKFVLTLAHGKRINPIGSIFKNPCTFQSSPIFLKSLFLVNVGEFWNFLL